MSKVELNFKDELIPRLLDESKTETRRPVKNNVPPPWKVGDKFEAGGAEFRIVGRRKERLQDITDVGVAAEGCGSKQEFYLLWETIYAEKCPWSSNPEVWVVEFRKIYVPQTRI